MNDKVLVAFASTHGSTQEVAEDVAATLRGHGLEVDLQPMRNVRTLDGYRAVVLGAPLYMFHLHKDAQNFLSKHQNGLKNGLPAAIFAGGSIEKADEEEYKVVQKQLDQEMAKFSWFHPVTIEIIGGRLDPTNLRFPWNLIPALKMRPPSDFRDWPAIRAWAGSLPRLFGIDKQ